MYLWLAIKVEFVKVFGLLHCILLLLLFSKNVVFVQAEFQVFANFLKHD